MGPVGDFLEKYVFLQHFVEVILVGLEVAMVPVFAGTQEVHKCKGAWKCVHLTEAFVYLLR